MALLEDMKRILRVSADELDPEVQLLRNGDGLIGALHLLQPLRSAPMLVMLHDTDLPPSI